MHETNAVAANVLNDFLLNERPNVVKNGSESSGNALQGGTEDYLHEAAGTNDLASGIYYPESGTFCDPGRIGIRLASLGVHEHWNDATNKQYGRNLGKGTGLELVALTAPDLLSVREAGNQAVISWQGSLTGFRLQSAAHLAATNSWSDVSNFPVVVHGRNNLTNEISGARRLFRLIK